MMERVITIDATDTLSSLLGMVWRGGRARQAALLQIAGATMLAAGAVLALDLAAEPKRRRRRWTGSTR